MSCTFLSYKRTAYCRAHRVSACGKDASRQIGMKGGGGLGYTAEDRCLPQLVRPSRMTVTFQTAFATQFTQVSYHALYVVKPKVSPFRNCLLKTKCNFFTHPPTHPAETISAFFPSGCLSLKSLNSWSPFSCSRSLGSAPEGVQTAYI